MPCSVNNFHIYQPYYKIGLLLPSGLTATDMTPRECPSNCCFITSLPLLICQIFIISSIPPVIMKFSEVFSVSSAGFASLKQSSLKFNGTG